MSTQNNITRVAKILQSYGTKVNDLPENLGQVLATLRTDVDGKQAKLTAGQNITLTGTTISVSDIAWAGTQAQWDALSSAQKAQYAIYGIT